MWIVLKGNMQETLETNSLPHPYPLDQGGAENCNITFFS